jgi:hypothetical protein
MSTQIENKNSTQLVLGLQELKIRITEVRDERGFTLLH